MIVYRGTEYESVLEAAEIHGVNYATMWRMVHVREGNDTPQPIVKPKPKKKTPNLKSLIKPFGATRQVGRLFNVIYETGEDQNIHLCDAHYRTLYDSGVALSIHLVNNTQAQPCVWCEKDRLS